MAVLFAPVASPLQRPPLCCRFRWQALCSWHTRRCTLQRPVTGRLQKVDCSSVAQPVQVHMAPGIGQPLPHLQQVGCVYLDYNATTPIFPEVAGAMQPYLLHHFGNPSSSHAYGRECKAAVDKARQQVASLIDAAPSEVFFTSCGTESDNWAITGVVMAARRRHAADCSSSGSVPHVVTSAIEHPAVLECLKYLKQQGLADFTAVPVDGQGLVSVDSVAAAIQPGTVLVSIMHSNNEVGSLQPVRQIAQLARRRGVLVHTDAAQSLGKVAVSVRDLGVDLMTVVGHKFGAPKGIAALYAREGVQLDNVLHGGGQEQGRRAGTENVLLAVGLGAAAELAARELPALTAHQRRLRDRLQAALQQRVPRQLLRVNGPADEGQRLPNTLSVGIAGLSSGSLLVQLKDRLAASAGSACHSTSAASISAVLSAMAVPPEFAVGTLRLSVGRHTTEQEVDAAVELVLEAARKQGVL